MTAKVLADLPMDSFFAGIFTTVLKRVSGLAISWGKVTATFSLLTTAGASLGLALGCWSPDAQMSKTASVPVLVLLMVVGVINVSSLMYAGQQLFRVDLTHVWCLVKEF